MKPRLFKLTIKYRGNGKTVIIVYPFPQDVIIALAGRYSAKSFDIKIVRI